MTPELKTLIAAELIKGGVPGDFVAAHLANIAAEIGDLPATQDGSRIRASMAKFWQSNADLFGGPAQAARAPEPPMTVTQRVVAEARRAEAGR